MWETDVCNSSGFLPASLLTQAEYCWFPKWDESVVSKLKVLMVPEIPVKYCRQPAGGLVKN